jgi:SAM-dependent methyltransferase
MHMSKLQKLSNLFKAKVECPICGYKSTKLQTYGDPPRLNAKCPSCNSLERMRMIWHFLVNEKNFLTAKIKLLHIAPDRGFYSEISKLKNIDYTAGDYFAEGYTYEKDVVNLDITNLYFEDSTFDALICVHVLEHIVEDAKAMTEVLRVLKPGGWAILQVPIDVKREKTFEDWTITSAEERIKHFGQWDHVRQYGLDYKDRLEKAGFIVEQINYVEKVGRAMAAKFAFPEKDDIYLCYKK